MFYVPVSVSLKDLNFSKAKWYCALSASLPYGVFINHTNHLVEQRLGIIDTGLVS